VPFRPLFFTLAGVPPTPDGRVPRGCAAYSSRGRSPCGPPSCWCCCPRGSWPSWPTPSTTTLGPLQPRWSTAPTSVERPAPPFAPLLLLASLLPSPFHSPFPLLGCQPGCRASRAEWLPCCCRQRLESVWTLACPRPHPFLPVPPPLLPVPPQPPPSSPPSLAVPVAEFSLSKIKKATKNFTTVYGRGSFGTVYLGEASGRAPGAARHHQEGLQPPEYALKLDCTQPEPYYTVLYVCPSVLCNSSCCHCTVHVVSLWCTLSLSCMYGVIVPLLSLYSTYGVIVPLFCAAEMGSSCSSARWRCWRAAAPLTS